MRPRRSLVAFVAVVIAAMLAPAASAVVAPGEIVVGDLPGTDGQWQYGEAVVDAPADQVQRWLGDVARWPERYPDVEWAQELGTTPDGKNLVRFRSSIVGRTMTLRMHEQPGTITYDGEGKNVTTHGRIFVQKLGSRRTRVILQSTAEVHGLAGVFATKGLKRERAEEKIRSDLTSIVRLSRIRG